jgi:hypothetical protein
VRLDYPCYLENLDHLEHLDLLKVTEPLEVLLSPENLVFLKLLELPDSQ